MAGIVAASLVGATSAALGARRIQELHARHTYSRLRVLQAMYRGQPMPVSGDAEITAFARTGQKPYCRREGDQVGTHACERDDETIEAFDDWGRPLLYRCPGVVHPRGWDLYSVGPNGIDDQGQGDDLLVGEDVAEVTSR